jgi:myo-inositol-1(or 4)-monophosphatase
MSKLSGHGKGENSAPAVGALVTDLTGRNLKADGRERGTIEQIAVVAHSAADRAADAAIAVRTEGSLNCSYKSSRDLLTAADLASEKQIISTIQAAFADHAILSEESLRATPEQLARGPLWIVDPIDGTVNFSRGIRHWAISIAFAIDGKVQYGIVFAPDLGERYEATLGSGAFLNGNAIRSREPSSLVDTLVATGFPYDRSATALIAARAERVLKSCADLRRFGAASLDCCLVASGRIDAYYEDVAPWDIAAGALIVREAGGATGPYQEAEQSSGLTPPRPSDLVSERFLATGTGGSSELRAQLIQLLRPPVA